jgi:cell division protein FtsL
MARRSATAAAARPAPARRAPIRRPPRRMSGSATGGAVALPRRVMRAPFTRAARARAGGVLDRLLQGRAWIALVAVLLVGIVFFNVDLLELNRDIARTADQASEMKQENARLRLKLARLASTERIQSVAARRGLELPPPGQVRYVRVHPGLDARKAAPRIRPPGEGEKAPVTSGAPAPAPAPAPAAAPTPQPTQTPQPTPTPQPAPAPTPQQTPPALGTAPTTGAGE